MNRKQRREMEKELRKNGVSKQVAKDVVAVRDGKEMEEGTKVKLNYKRIITHPDWKKKLRKEYKDWIETHKDDIFTVEWDEMRKSNNTVDKKIRVCLAEDTTVPKWLFLTTDLIPVSQAKIKLNNGKEIPIDGINSDLSNINEVINEALENDEVSEPIEVEGAIENEQLNLNEST